MPAVGVVAAPGPMPVVGIAAAPGPMPAVGVANAPGPMPAVGVVEAPGQGHPYRGSGVNRNGSYRGRPLQTVRQQPFPRHSAPVAGPAYRPPGGTSLAGGSSIGGRGIMGSSNGAVVDEVSLRLAAVSEALSLLQDVAIIPRLYGVAGSVQVEVEGRAEMQAKTDAASRIERVSDNYCIRTYILRVYVLFRTSMVVVIVDSCASFVGAVGGKGVRKECMLFPTVTAVDCTFFFRVACMVPIDLRYCCNLSSPARWCKPCCRAAGC